jgi:hypothetical protein
MYGDPLRGEEQFCLRRSCSEIDSMQIDEGHTGLKAFLGTWDWEMIVPGRCAIRRLVDGNTNRGGI